ncbi:MAG: hypothetical protein ABL925_01000 [Methylococcales bacterium]
MLAAKQEALNAISKLPDDTDIDEIMYQLYVLAKIRKGQDDIENHRTLSSSELQRAIEQW